MRQVRVYGRRRACAVDVEGEEMGRLESCCIRRGPPPTLNDAKPANFKSQTLPSVYLWDRSIV
jgi:hypothetical protein